MRSRRQRGPGPESDVEDGARDGESKVRDAIAAVLEDDEALGGESDTCDANFTLRKKSDSEAGRHDQMTYRWE
jgi:hypothetical protein